MSPTCPPKPSSAAIEGEPIIGRFSFQHIVHIIGWVCFGITAVFCMGLCILHFSHYRAPNEQRNVFRIIIFPVVASLAAVISIYSYRASGYIEPIASLYEAIALASLFLLYVQYVAPEESTRVAFFRELEYKTKNGSVKPLQHYKLFRAAWTIVFSYVVVYTILVIAQEVTQATGVYCETSNKPAFAHIWLQAFQLITTIVAVVTVIRFQRRLKDHMVGHNALPKLLSFKLFVLITTIQHFVFSVIGSRATGSKKLTYDDITIGLQSLLVCIEALVCQISFYFFFHAKEFAVNKHEGAKDGAVYSPMKAFLHALNPIDLILSIGRAYGLVRS
ncbi:hypothetical protein LTR99_001860 [Exophiala xenobiotica]|uniref:DUF300-domain-containing protein n=1 Tax=Vermiconidia calcicola TaxID=1690605 RepID=A0AAV9Q930_9PEZI|nr:hypothetical protein LTR41_002280 [Exophiala xenobiotica]KAK5531095.1 hypothetical protein LTR23_010141 [Chaetothyriales sp. CCFEE 6169]KAK5536628.1 hypothetical protein LTR25_005302 [Vermiconidia calcicola]KAK5235130.1 hypothetical protein LTR47_003966 [Exophiala xenobiotica]KAK5254429.1 hypothetical protein LTS06_001263 [Exophiala xenobiotica]